MTSRHPILHRRDFLALVVAAPLVPSALNAAPSSKLIAPEWARFGDRAEIDHSPWTAFLTRYRRLGADGVARLDYRGVSQADRAALDAYLAALQSLRPSELTRDAAFAFWANLYNALTVTLVLEAYPVSSIKKVRGGLFDTGPWDETVAEVDGRGLSLDDIEHGVLRPIFRDPRVHYAVNCASIGCPNLPEAAFAAGGLDARLDALAMDYVNHPRGARTEGGRLRVSSIYEWFKADFGGDDAGVIGHLRRYARPDLAAALRGVTRIAGDDYDWSLNDVAG